MSTPSQVPQYQQYQPRPRSIFGPLVLITIGVLFLLRSTGLVSFQTFRSMARYWPVLLIIWGVAKLVEHFAAVQRGVPTPRMGAGGIVFLVFFIIFGMGAWETRDWNWGGLRTEFGWDDWGGGWFGGNRYEFTEDFTQPLQGSSAIKVLSARGDINVTASADNQAHVSMHKFLRSDSQDSANRLNDSIHPRFTQQGSTWVLDLTSGELANARFDLDLQLPRGAAVSLATQHDGNLSVSQINGDVELSARNGNATVEQVKGNATVHLRHGSITVKGVTGDVQLEGGFTDGEISDIAGKLDFDAARSGYSGTIQLARIAQSLHFKSIRTDLRLNGLAGEMTMGDGSLRGSSVTGPLRLSTSSNDVHLENVSGEITVENSNRVVEIRATAPLGNIEVNNRHGGIELDLPDNAGFRLDAQSRDGNIDVSGFSINVDNARHDATATGTVGKGGPDIRLRADRGTIQVRKQ
jgi:DUF4097 and DUF4098 domain-containing protein YvlB